MDIFRPVGICKGMRSKGNGRGTVQLFSCGFQCLALGAGGGKSSG